MPERATLEEVDGGRSLRFLFNPKEFTVAKSATWNRPHSKGARSTSIPEFGGVQPQSVSMEVFFDRWAGGEQGSMDVSEDIGVLLDWLKPTPKSINQRQPQPQILRFQWGSNRALSEFRGFLKSVNTKYTMFLADGTPVRATATISLEEIPSEPERQNPTSGATDARRNRVVNAAESLQSIAVDEYGSARLWRGLAAFNGLDDPLRLRPGTRLLVPSLSEAEALS